ncbi:hypothetical protein [Streptomyces spinosisporus]|uniref:CopG family transcriptional regulator n=1 Tax=Streptomyces spinosisporus TaxID=2927582 RepID=A0ABS9XH79_9ACTN|nr:hypothetical protein [Streptomyces spinosisporus]MCI3240267.1 hypothetical protein [Streptomyces spinosisporus]
MPNAPKTPARQIRIGDQWYDFDEAAKALGTDRATLIREFISWFLRKPGAKMPERPPAGPWSADKEPPVEEASDG